MPFNIGHLDVNDYDGDGKLDAAVVTGVGFNIYRGDGAGSFHFASEISYSGVNPQINGITSGDVNGDHKADIVVTNQINQGAVTYIGNGDGTFQKPMDSPTHISGGMLVPTQVVLRDVNGDGNLDMVVVNSQSNDITVLPGKGDGNFYTAQRFICGEVFSVSLAVDYFYRQAIPDIGVLTLDRSSANNNRHVRILKNGSR